MAHIPASIRYKNPGAMWGHNPVAEKWGALDTVVLHDGLGQGNNIAVFPTYVQGICAQIDLWRSPRYHNKRFADAIEVWSGGNDVGVYIAFVLKRVPGMTANTLMTDAFLDSPTGISFLKAQAWHEAGEQYPAPDADWLEAQRRVFHPASVAATVTKAPVTKKTATAVATGTASAAAAHQAGLPPWAVGLIGIGVAVVVLFIWSRKS